MIAPAEVDDDIGEHVEVVEHADPIEEPRSKPAGESNPLRTDSEEKN